MTVVFDTTSNQWTVTDKSGLQYTYGAEALSRTGADVNSAGGTFSWGLSSVVDTNGNRIDYSYNGGLYPYQVDYGGNPAAGYPHRFHVHLDYEGRADQAPSFVGGFEQRVTGIVTTIRVWVDGLSTYQAPTTLYTLRYEPAADTGWSQLVEVTRAGADGGAFPSTTFTYQQPTHAFGAERTMSFGEPRMAGTDGVLIGWDYGELMDADGDSRTDWVQVALAGVMGPSNYFKVARNLGDRFATPVPWGASPMYGYVRDPFGGFMMQWADLTGDGLPDYLLSPSLQDPISQFWDVQRNTGTGLAPNTPWQQPIWYFDEPEFLSASLGQPRDINGDGLADLLECTTPTDNGEKPSATFPYCTFHRNNGSDFSGPVLWRVPPNVTLVGRHGRALAKGLFDLNGDGLPDLVSSEPNIATGPAHWDVFWNTGHGFADTPAFWLAPSQSGEARLLAEAHFDEVSESVHITTGLHDMNGDGLPDYVDAGTQPWTVFTNTGEGFADVNDGVPWQSSPSVPYISRTSSSKAMVVFTDLRDLTGDGCADYVSSIDASTLFVVPADAPRAGVLTAINNGLGATMSATYVVSTDLATQLQTCGGTSAGDICQYNFDCPASTCAQCTDCMSVPFPLGLVSTITTDTGFAGAGNVLTRTYRYSRPYFDPDEREFAGFRFVEESHPAGRRVLTEYSQPGDIRDANARAAARPFKGKPVRRVLRGTTSTQPVFSAGEFSWSAAPLSAERTQVHLASRTDTSYSAGAGPTQQLRTDFLQYDEDNNLTLSSKQATNLPTVWTTVSYVRNLNPQDTIRDRPASVRVSTATRLAEKQFDYDSHGNVTAIREWLDTTDTFITTATLAYDPSVDAGAAAAGQPTRITDARGNITTVEYDAHYGIFPSTITNALGQPVTLAYDLEWGKLHSRADANGDTTSITYDDFGRQLAVTRPLDTSPWRMFEYTFGGAGVPSRVATFVREPTATGGYRQTNAFFDSLGRALENKRDEVVEGSSTVVVSDAVSFDAAGRVASRAAAFAGTLAVDVYESAPGDAGFVSLAYDALDRVIRTTNSDGTYRSANYDTAGQTVTYDENYNACTSTCTGRQSVEERDALGRIIQVRSYEARTNLAPTLKARTATTYDALDRVTGTTSYTNAADSGSNATTVTFSYDSLGRRTQLTDPDSGTWTYRYDDAGNLLFQDDPKTGQHLEFCYDALNRLQCKYGRSDDVWSGNGLCPTTANSGCPAATGAEVLAAYYYDFPLDPQLSNPGSLCEHGLGRLCQVDDRPGAATGYTGSTSFSYDARGRATASSKRITIDAGFSAGFTFLRTYDAADHLKTINYPTDTASEILTYTYDAGGRVVTASTPGQVYLSNAQYDRFGRLLSQAYGPSLLSNRWSYADGAAGPANQFRLQEIRAQGGSNLYQQFSYGPYDPSGNLLGVRDANAYATGFTYTQGSSRDNDWDYTYDGLGRVMSADGVATWGAPTDFQYDNYGNLITRDPPSFTHQTAQPHRIRYSSPPGSASTYQYDANGALTWRPDTDSTGADSAHTIAYDLEGRVSSVTAGTATVAYYHDYSGARVAHRDDTVPVFTFGDWFDYQPGVVGTLTRYVWAGGRRIAQSTLTSGGGFPQLARTDSGGQPTLLARTLDDVWRGGGLIYPHYALAAEDAAKLGALLLLVVIVLDLTPGRARLGIAIGRHGVFRRVRRGHVIVLAVAFGLSLTPLTCVRPARGGGGGGGGGGAPPPSFPVFFLHSDHLGSTTMVTCYQRPAGEECADGTPAQYFRYDAYGAMKAFTTTGTAVSAGQEKTAQLYTGQRWEWRARVYDYGARMYDPRIARFLSPDPVREYMNPFAYVAWNPVKFVDPTGMFIGLGGELIAATNYGMPIESYYRTTVTGLAWVTLLAMRGLIGSSGPNGTRAASSGGNFAGFRAASPTQQLAALLGGLAQLAENSFGAHGAAALAAMLNSTDVDVGEGLPGAGVMTVNDAPKQSGVNILVGAGGSATAITGAELSGGVFVNPGLLGSESAAGMFGSGGATTGLNISADLFIGFVAGDLAGTTVNANMTAGFFSVSFFFNPTTGELVGATVGYGPSATQFGLSTSLSTTGTIAAWGR
ncbi:MAG: hypothetical protein HY699_14665 [Deltaproteobacteria bacterium]|nr:hypothetical protein [Deltaproteobacteria bacterium]